jgi:hypothetical protein
MTGKRRHAFEPAGKRRPIVRAGLFVLGGFFSASAISHTAAAGALFTIIFSDRE